MSMFSKGKGLFGAPMMPAGGTFAPDGVSSSPAAAALAPSTETYQAPKRTFLDKLGLVADAFRGTHENSDMLQMQDDRAYQNWQRTAGAQLARANDFADWERRQNWELQHPKTQAEDNFTRTLRNAGIDPTSPQAMALYRQKAMTDASPAPNFVSDGAGGGRWVTPPAASLLPTGPGPTAPVGRLTPLGAGGATPQGARTFPVR